MKILKFLQRKKLYALGPWVLCGGFCVLLGACSTLGLTDHQKGDTSSTPSANLVNQSIADKGIISPTPAIQAYYHSPSQQSTVFDLPDAQDYSIDENPQWVDELNTAPEWKQTLEELPLPSPEETPPLAPQETAGIGIATQFEIVAPNQAVNTQEQDMAL